ncbi:MAG: fumarate hydratase [Lentisphaerae bacterium]|jgi:L(+)-tartrate dehydratase alpha subunit|nr:fumarate hydratase [Lentisphaerota bacterium]MBT4814717.1 fumarate hydratase [Lentisphaerota bacterium]MBT5605799.1 fumarate hydratase [Lentisphaerota bacterium]MBT7055828.1 fumarate hydratase [Lentisphaerota bacterium]MBT7847487.1 fumarate hydratase [Lentisphaerota bacterium]
MLEPAAIAEAMFEATRRAATRLPPDVKAALQAALAEETDPVSRAQLESSLHNAQLAEEGNGLVCADTGFPLFFITAGPETRINGGFGTLKQTARDAVARATAANLLRPTMVDPIARTNPGDNIGPGMPKLELTFAETGAGLDIIAAPKGGGSEIFGTFYRMMYPSDGMDGIKTFAIQCIRDACYAGKICPPAIIGIGIGGTADLCMKLAKEAALLTPVGATNPDPVLEALEHDLLAASRSLGIGPMGAHGINAVLAVSIRKAVTHTAALPVAINAQCMVGRRWRAVMDSDGRTTYTGILAQPESQE